MSAEFTPKEIANNLEISEAEALEFRNILNDFVKHQSQSWKPTDKEENFTDYIRGVSGRHTQEIPMVTSRDLPEGGMGQSFLVVSNYPGRMTIGGVMCPMSISIAKGIRATEEGLFIKEMPIGELKHGTTQVYRTSDSGKVRDNHLYFKFSGVLPLTTPIDWKVS